MSEARPDQVTRLLQTRYIAMDIHPRPVNYWVLFEQSVGPLSELNCENPPTNVKLDIVHLPPLPCFITTLNYTLRSDRWEHPDGYSQIAFLAITLFQRRFLFMIPSNCTIPD